MEQQRFTETGETILSFTDEFLVRCPVCQSLATIRKVDSSNKDLFAPRRFVCSKCGFIKDWAERSLLLETQADPPVDACLGFPLFLAASCCGKILWAYNLRHLSLIEEYVQATLRTRTKDPKYGWNNQGVVNRLPQWMIVAKNRNQVLKTIAKLKQDLQHQT